MDIKAVLERLLLLARAGADDEATRLMGFLLANQAHEGTLSLLDLIDEAYNG